jgi:hypothetical protein
MSDVKGDSDFWQNANVDKSQSDNLLQSLEARAANGKPMLGFQLAQSNLVGINLVNGGESKGFDMLDCDLYRSNLHSAHLFAINLQGSSLMKADLRGANLHCADLRDCNLLGVKLDGAHLANIEWGETVLQEKLAQKALEVGDNTAAMDLYEQAEEVYRMLRLQLERDGLFEEAGRFYCKEMVARRKQLPRFSYSRYLSKSVDLFCGYGEKPLRVIIFSIAFIMLWAVIYFSLGIQHDEETVGFFMSHSILANLMDFLSCVYFSVVTFTTLGYGDLTPGGIVRMFCAFQAFFGSFTMALFVVVFVKKMTR